MNIIFPIIILFLNTSPQAAVGRQDTTSSQINIYLVKNSWHTGIVFKMSDVYPGLDILQEFQQYDYVDIGWGDAEFYQHPGFDAGLAVKALFYPTPSAVRIEGFNLTIERYIELSDMAVLLEIENAELDSLLSFISDTFIKDENSKPVILSRRASGHIIFYKANGNYHLFNTCNTWIAKGLNYSGLEIKDHIILAEQLFRESAEKGILLKAQEGE